MCVCVCVLPACIPPCLLTAIQSSTPFIERTFTVSVQNTGTMDGDEAVLLYAQLLVRVVVLAVCAYATYIYMCECVLGWTCSFYQLAY